MKKLFLLLILLPFTTQAGSFMDPIKASEVAKRWFSFKGGANSNMTVNSCHAVFDTLSSDSITKFFNGTEPYKDIYFASQKPVCYLFNVSSTNGKKICIMVGADSMYTPPIVIYTFADVEQGFQSSFHPRAWTIQDPFAASDDWMRMAVYRMKVDIENMVQYDKYSVQWSSFFGQNNDLLGNVMCYQQGQYLEDGNANPNSVYTYVDVDKPSIFETKQSSRWGYKAPYFRGSPCSESNNMGCVPLALAQIQKYYRWPKAPNKNGFVPFTYNCYDKTKPVVNTGFDYDFDNWHYEDMAFRLRTCAIHLIYPPYIQEKGFCPTCADNTNPEQIIGTNREIEATSKISVGTAGLFNDIQAFNFIERLDASYIIEEGSGVYLQNPINNPLDFVMTNKLNYNATKYVNYYFNNQSLIAKLDTVLLFQLYKNRPMPISIYYNGGHMIVATGYECRKFFTFAWGRGGEDDHLRLYFFSPPNPNLYKNLPINFQKSVYDIQLWKDIFPDCSSLLSSDNVTLNLQQQKASYNQVRNRLFIEGTMDTKSDYMGFAGSEITIQNEFEAAKGSTLYLNIETCGQ